MRTPVIAALTTLLIFLIVASMMLRSEKSVEASELDRAAVEIQTSINAQVSALYSVLAFMQSSESVSHEEFKGFLEIAKVETLAPGMQGVGFAKAVRPDQPEIIVSALSENYGIARAPWPETDQDIRFPIVLLEPSDERNETALGYDMYSEAVRREAMDAAIATREAAATSKVTLVQEIDEDVQAGFLIYLPVIDNVTGEIDGFAYAPYRAGDLFRTALSAPKLQDIVARAYVETVSDETLMFSSMETIKSPARFTLSVANREWVILIDHPKPFFSFFLRSSTLTGLFGILMAGLVGALFHAQQQQVAAKEKLATEQTDRASERQLMLQEIKHRLKNGLARIQAIIQLSAPTDEHVQAYANGLSGRLSAMANAQDLLTQTRWQTAQLRELIRAEIVQFVDAQSPIVSMDGPDITLEGSSAQAISLVSHELATNAAKYGAFKQAGHLTINWAVVKENDMPMVRLIWEESDLNETPTFSHSGFGSTLISLMIETQLRGRFERTATDNKMTISILFPHDSEQAETS